MGSIRTIFISLFTLHLLLPSLVFGHDVDEILKKMQEANASIRYQGMLTTVFISTPFTQVYRYKIVNYGNLLRKEELLTDGVNKEVNLDDGKYLWRFFPYKNLVIKEKSRIQQEASCRIQDELELVKQSYVIQIVDEYNINDRKGYKVLFKPKKPDRPQQIYWIDSETGIPFKIEKYGPNNTLVSVSSFSEINFQLPDTPTKAPFLMVPPHTSLAEIQERSNLTFEKAKNLMQMQVILPGYIPSGFVLKNIIFRAQGEGKDLQLFYTDGLSALSVFQTQVKEEDTKSSSSANETRSNGAQVQFNVSGTLNILKVKSKPIATTLVGEVFKTELLKVAESLTPLQVNTPFGPLNKNTPQK